MAERLVVSLNNTYGDDYKLVSTVKIMDGNATVSEWTTDDPRAILHQGIEAAEPNTFEQVKVKKMLEKAAQLFEPINIAIIPKEK